MKDKGNHRSRRRRNGLNSAVWGIALLLSCSNAIAETSHSDGGVVPPKGVAVVVGSNADKLERSAAEELCDYLDKLFGIKTQPTTGLPDSAKAILLVGSPDTNPNVAKAMGKKVGES